MSTTTTKPATASGVTRTLVAAGLQRSVTSTTAVRGYTVATAGISSRNLVTTTRVRVKRGLYADRSQRMVWEATNHPTGEVQVEYTLGRWDQRNNVDRAAKTAEVMAQVAEALTAKGYTVDVQQSMSGESVAIVTR